MSDNRVIDTGLTENDLLHDLAARVKQRKPKHTRLPGDVTSAEIVKASGEPKQRVLEMLKELQAAGEIIGLNVVDHGKRTYVYRKANNGA